MASSDKTYHGGCHCGYLRYSVELDLTHPVGERCNCSSCQNRGILILEVNPPSNFTLISPTSREDSKIGRYSPKGGSLHFFFCKACGVNCFYQGMSKEGDKETEYLKINGLTLDSDKGVDFTKFKI